MGTTKRRQIKCRQKVKRRKKRAKLRKQGLNPDDFYVGAIRLGLPKS